MITCYGDYTVLYILNTLNRQYYERRLTLDMMGCNTNASKPIVNKHNMERYMIKQKI